MDCIAPRWRNRAKGHPPARGLVPRRATRRSHATRRAARGHGNRPRWQACIRHREECERALVGGGAGSGEGERRVEMVPPRRQSARHPWRVRRGVGARRGGRAAVAARSHRVRLTRVAIRRCRVGCRPIIRCPTESSFRVTEHRAAPREPAVVRFQPSRAAARLPAAIRWPQRELA